MSKPRRIRITHVHNADAHSKASYQSVGLEGNFVPDKFHSFPGYFSGNFYSPEVVRGRRYFLGIRYRRI